ncbi:hypothetical protein QLS31_04105 [Flavobacterium sp. XS2P24]|uniref:hypothetical protein n=1 Tax=Flavobacterium sp. XS2P24 TaxID=3041249 RepID=UPI0024A8CB42|nr:hypothetical protein [Flavobacterium sp. XS2P24]MDI6049005.1 hypothetical protein [Flavobacterium sp. XS2P24]
MNQILEIIYSHLCNEENYRLITIEKTEPTSISSYEYEEFRKDVKERLKIKLKTGLCSEFLINQLAIHKANLGEKYSDKIEFYNVSEILNLIEKIENDKLVGLPYNKEPLKGYLHIHHNTYSGFGASLVRNVKEYWFKNGVIRPHRVEEFEEILNQHSNGKLSTVAIMMHQKAVFNRNLRGEWLIYRIVDSKKYYLCLASHREGVDRVKSDENIFVNKISKCLLEFSELK